jgi:hypothetical protein
MANQPNYQFGPWYDTYTGWPVLTMVAEGDVEKGMVVQLGTAGRQVKEYDGDAGVSEPAIGLALERADDGDEITIIGLGPVMLMNTGTNGCTRGDWVVPETTAAEDGYVMTDDGVMGTTKNAVIGIALETTDTKEEKVPVMVCGRGIFGAN